VHGSLLHDVPNDARLVRLSGAYLGRVTRALADYSHAGLVKTLSWDLAQTAHLRPFAVYVQNERARSRVIAVLDAFDRDIEPILTTLPHSVIHGDWNDANVIVVKTGTDEKTCVDNGDEYVISGCIDVGDSVYSITVADLAIGVAYALVGQVRRSSFRRRNS
jgi:hydroxylysine kinase